MMTTKFLVKVNGVGARGPQYVQRIGGASVETTSDRKLALTMGRLTAEDAIKSIQTSRNTPELIPVRVPA